MARQPSDFRAEGQHWQRIQSRQRQHSFRQSVRDRRTRTLERQPVFGSTAGRQLYGLQHSNPVDTFVAYGDAAGGQGNSPANASTFGTTSDPLVGQRVGGINVFGGGLVLYQGGVRVGGLGVSGDTSCTDHMVAWRTRNALKLDRFGGVGSSAGLTVTGDPNHPDNIIFDIKPNPNGGTGISTGGFGHPTCLNNPTPAAVSGLPPVTH
jgi:hypothetical protein